MNTSVLLKIKEVSANIGKFNTGRWVTDDEGAILYSLTTMFRPSACFESGTANGYSSLWLASALGEDSRVYTFDPVNRAKIWDHSYISEQSGDLVVPNRIKAKVIYTQSTFSEGVGAILAECDGTKLFFIDGEHSQTSVQEDIDAIKPFIQPNDIIVFHDAAERSVIKRYLLFIKELQASNSLDDMFHFHTRRGIKVLKIR